MMSGWRHFLRYSESGSAFFFSPSQCSYCYYDKEGRGRAALRAARPRPFRIASWFHIPPQNGRAVVLAVPFCSFYFDGGRFRHHWPSSFVKKKLDSGHVRWEFPHMKSLTVDDRQRVRLPKAKAGQVFAYETNCDGTIKLVPVILKGSKLLYTRA